MGNIVIGDVNGDGYGDLILGAPNADFTYTNSGSCYVMFSTLIDDVGSSTGNSKPLSTSTNYNIRYDGQAASMFITNSSAAGGSKGIKVGDVNGDGYKDLVICSPSTYSGSFNVAGSAFVIFSTLIDDVGSSTGNNKALSTGSNYNIQYLGGIWDMVLTTCGTAEIGDVNGDGLGDLVLGGIAQHGYAYVIFS